VGASEASKDRIELLDADPDRCIDYLFQLVCSDFAPKQNEPATLKQCIAVQAAQNVNHVDIIAAEWKRIAALGFLNSAS